MCLTGRARTTWLELEKEELAWKGGEQRHFVEISKFSIRLFRNIRSWKEKCSGDVKFHVIKHWKKLGRKRIQGYEPCPE